MTEKLTKEKYNEIVLELARKGMTNEKIGLLIKKEHKVVPRSIEKISKILKRNNLVSNPDNINLKKSVDKLTKHAQIHKQDRTFKRALSVKSAKLRKLR